QASDPGHDQQQRRGPGHLRWGPELEAIPLSRGIARVPNPEFDLRSRHAITGRREDDVEVNAFEDVAMSAAPLEHPETSFRPTLARRRPGTGLLGPQRRAARPERGARGAGTDEARVSGRVCRAELAVGLYE